MPSSDRSRPPAEESQMKPKTKFVAYMLFAAGCYLLFKEFVTIAPPDEPDQEPNKEITTEIPREDAAADPTASPALPTPTSRPSPVADRQEQPNPKPQTQQQPPNRSAKPKTPPKPDTPPPKRRPPSPRRTPIKLTKEYLSTLRKFKPEPKGEFDDWVEPSRVLDGLKDAAKKMMKRFYKPHIAKLRSEISIIAAAEEVEELRQKEVRKRDPPNPPTHPAWSGICWVIQIVNKKVYVIDTGREKCTYRKEKTGKDFYETFFARRRRMATKLIQDVVNAATDPIPNLEMIHCVGDCPLHTLHDHQVSFYPVFSTTYCAFSNNIPFPQWEPGRSGGPPEIDSLPEWLKTKREFSQQILSTNFTEKKPMAVYRGAWKSRGCMCNQWGPPRPQGENCYWQGQCGAAAGYGISDYACGRKKLMLVGQENPTVIDYRDKHMSMMDQARQYQMVMHMEGTCGWADRLSTLLALPMAIVKQMNWCGEWYNVMLRPWQHYIPVDCFLENAVKKVQEAAKNTTALKEMVQRANDYARAIFQPRVVKGYAEKLLREYARLMEFDKSPLKEPSVDAIDVNDYPWQWGGLKQPA